MSLKKVQLRKLLVLMFAERAQRRSVLRADIRDQIKKSVGQKSDGGDFHIPFWYDAKAHVNGEQDLRIAMLKRVTANKGRERLYPLLTDGFLDWWNNKRRWTNEPSSSEMLTVRGALELEELQCVVKIENLLALAIGNSTNRIVYPYFSEEPALVSDAARLGLWAITEALPNYEQDDFRLLDVLRGKSFSCGDLKFTGSERENFIKRYSALMVEWTALWKEYEPA